MSVRNWVDRTFRLGCHLKRQVEQVIVSNFPLCKYFLESSVFEQIVEDDVKLLYFAQRESLIQTDLPLFNATFYGWKYGPVLKEVRRAFHKRALPRRFSPSEIAEMMPIMSDIISIYGGKDSWSLSRLTHGEYSWQRSREGIPENSKSDNPIRLQDIKKDAARIKERRIALKRLGLT